MAILPLFEIRAEELDRVFEDWYSDFETYLKSKENGFGIIHATDFEQIQQFDSYKKFVKIKDSKIETKMLGAMGEYPYSPQRLYLAFPFCERQGWKWKDVLKEYPTKVGMSGLPDAVRMKWAESQKALQ